MSRFSEFAKNVGMMVGQSFVQRILGLLTTMILARVLGAASFGAYSVVANTASSAFGLVKLGIDTAIHVNTAESHPDEETRRRKGEMLAAGFVLLGLAGGVGALTCLVLSDWLAFQIFGNRSLALWIRVAGAAVLLQVVSQFCYVTMAGLQRFGTYGRIMIGCALINTAAITFGALIAELYGAVTAMISAQAFTAIQLLRSTTRTMREESLQLTLRNFVPRAAELIRAGFPFYAAGLISIPITYFLQGMVVVSGGLEALGYLRAISALVMIVTFVPVSASGPMISMLARTRTESEVSLPSSIMRSIKMVLVFALLTAAMITIALPWLMPAVFGADYVAAIGAAGIALLSAVFTAVGAVIGSALFSARRLDLVFLATVVHMGIFCAAGALLIPIYGLVGYLLAELLGGFTLLLAAYWRSLPWLCQQRVRTAWLGKMLIPIFVLITYALTQTVQGETPSAAAAAIGVAGLALACVWIYQTILDSAERSALLRLIGRG